MLEASRPETPRRLAIGGGRGPRKVDLIVVVRVRGGSFRVQEKLAEKKTPRAGKARGG
jgi:hypothetical protein